MKCSYCGAPFDDNIGHCTNCQIASLLTVPSKEVRATKKLYRIITVLTIIFFILFDFFFLGTIHRAVNPYDYYPGRDFVLSTHDEIPLEGDKYTLVDSWYNPEHELHRYNVARDKVEWRDLNKQWHTDNIYPNFSKYLLALQLIITFVIYRKAKWKYSPKETYEIYKWDSDKQEKVVEYKERLK